MNRFLLTTILLAVCSTAYSQPQWIQHHARVIPEEHEGLFGLLSVDLNDDDWPDIVGGNFEFDRLCWWENLVGTFEFEEHVIDDGIEHPSYATFGDIDGDGDPDLAAWGRDDQELSVYYNLGQGSDWTKVIVNDDIPGLEGIHLVDIDLDGDLDLVAGLRSLPRRVEWYENVNNTGFGDVHDIPITMNFSASQYTIADVDLDGDPDIVVNTTSSIPDQIDWIENQDNATAWTTHTISPNYGLSLATQLYVNDINNDGTQEIVAGTDDGVVYWQTEDPHGTWNHTMAGTRPVMSNMCFADIDGDGDLDFTSKLRHTDTFAWWEFRPDGTWRERQICYTYLWANDHVLTDINNDGALDLVASQLYDGHFPSFENNLSGSEYSITVRSQHGFPITISRGGGNFSFRWTASNQTGSDTTLDIWAEIWSPSGEPLRAFNVHPGTLLPAGWQRAEVRWQYVPNYLPSGLNYFVAHIGTWPDQIIAADTLFINKREEWTDQLNADVVPTEPTALAASVDCSPNPFNAMTTVRVTLPEAAELRVVVYNVTGQQVAELANGSVAAGSHAYSFDATHLASGLYFVRATVPGQLDQTQKLMLIR
ncbi:T9SS type A sorting domain-containing protein [bacterium]|nr:T9SS type A sorting domain-containing protein [bacterium]